MLDTLQTVGASTLGSAWTVVWTLLKIVAVLLPLLGCVAYLTLWERKAIGWTQIRPGPNRVGPWGLLTPIADAVKLIFKEIIAPTAANKGLFFLGPIMTIIRRWLPGRSCRSVRKWRWPTSTPACCS